MTYQNNTNAFQSVTCDQGCQNCLPDDPSSCTQCLLGYYWTDYICFPCDPSCATCGVQNPTSCLSCYSNGFYNSTSKTCNYCSQSSNCLTCLESNLTSCTSCPLGFTISALNQQCTVLCPQDCLTCYYTTNKALRSLSGQSFICTSCETGYSVTWYGACLPCLANCRTCSGFSQSTCLSCGPGYYLYQGNCVACTEGCLSCNINGCLSCAKSYQLLFASSSNSIVCSPNCQFPCQSCQYNNASVCTACYFGYTLSTQTPKTCIPTAQNCTLTNGCYACPYGQVISGG